jgi:hypothetical protein
MSKRVSWAISDQNVTVNYDGETHIVPRSDALSDRLIKAVRENRLAEIPSLVSAAKRIEVLSKGNFVVKDGRVMVNGVAAPKVLSDKIIRFSNDGLPFQPLVRFAENLQKNPSFRAVNELFTFLEKNDHPITETGCFIAFKRVRSNFLDIHSGTMDNSVGNVMEVPRNQVDEDSSRTCSHGLHVANWTYAHTQFASSNPDTDVMLEVEVNPADVVAIPADYNNAKMRVCKYTVLGVVTTPFDPSTALRVVSPNYVAPDPFEDEEEDVCADCECEVCECEDCDYCQENPCCCEDEEEEEDEDENCLSCGVVLNDNEYEYCIDCDTEEEEEDDEEEETDRYPYEDELDEEE